MKKGKIALSQFSTRIFFLTTLFIGLACIDLFAGETCDEAVSLSDGYTHDVQFTNTNLNESWYSFIATEPDFHITINQFNGGSAVGASFGRFEITVFGAYGPCDSPCSSLNVRFNQILSHSNINWGIHQLIETYDISSNNLMPEHSWYPSQYFIRIESSFGNELNANMIWSFDMVGTDCCWPVQPNVSSPYALCDNYFNLVPGQNQQLNLSVGSTGINEFWLASTSPAGLQVPAGAIEFYYDLNNSDYPCTFMIQNPSMIQNHTIQIERYGPYNVCAEPCEQFNLNPVAVDTITAPEFNGVGFTIGTFSIPPGEEEQLWLYRVIYDVTCAPCEFTLEYDLTGGIAGFSDPDDLQAPCTNCLPVQGLLPDKKYIVTAWVYDEDIDAFISTISDAEVRVTFDGGSVLGNASLPSGPIIDGWQQIECAFTTPSSFSDFNIELNSINDVVYFDDVRLFPYNGSMKCYVYDPQNLRFVAELDERHFATFYEYDEEGRLMRIKKETERGVMTIQESKTSTVKRANVPD